MWHNWIKFRGLKVKSVDKNEAFHVVTTIGGNMKVTCDRCQNEIKAEHIDLDKGIAKCKNCNNIFDYRAQVASETDYRRDTIELPRCIRLAKNDESLVLEYRWISSRLIYLAPLCAIWDAVFFLWYRSGFISTTTLLSSFYMLFHFGSAVVLTYYCIADFINRTTISVSGGTLQVVDGPLTFFRNKGIALDELDQLYAREKRHRGKKLSWSSFEVHALLKTERNLLLVAGLRTSEQALYIEQLLEDYLGIRDRPVEGEIARE